jgi:hypothetical protein
MMLRLTSNTGLSGLPKSRPVCASKGRQLDRSGNGEGYVHVHRCILGCTKGVR